MIEYREIDSRWIDEIYGIYEENGWESYLGDREKLSQAYDQSLYIFGAFDEDKLVGFVRCVGDGAYIVYVQDLIIYPAYQRRGIGRKLMEQILKKYASVHQFVLITDRNDEASNAFYQAIGLSDFCDGYPINAYFKGGEKN